MTCVIFALSAAVFCISLFHMHLGYKKEQHKRNYDAIKFHNDLVQNVQCGILFCMIEFKPKEVDNHWLVVLGIYSEIWTIQLKIFNISSEFLRMHWTLWNLRRIGIVPNSKILFVQVLIDTEIGFIAENVFSTKVSGGTNLTSSCSCRQW